MRLPYILKRLRKEKKITQQQLAKETGLSLAAIVAYENGLREPNSKAMVVLERYFEVSGAFLRGELTEPTFYEDEEMLDTLWNVIIDEFEEFKDKFKYSSEEKKLFSAKLLKDTLQYMNSEILPDDFILPEDIGIENQSKIFDLLKLLNIDGKSELVKRTLELTQLPQYKK